MSVDFQVCFPQQVVPLNSVRILPGLSPKSLDILGTDFRSVDQVLINELVSPDVVILSKTRLLAQVPTDLQNSALNSVSVISTKLTVSSRSTIKFRIGRTPSKVSGILRLVQIFLKVMLTTTGIDIFAPRIGGNALKNIGLTFGKNQGGAIVSDIIVAVSTTQKQIMAIQGRDPTIPRDERLLAANVKSASYNRQEAALIVSVELTSQAGRAATANIVV
jgi:hypothetical protein